MAAGKQLRIEPLTGAALAGALPDVARLRIEVFRAWPYVYEGTLAYEQDYLAELVRARDAVIVAAFDGDRIVGAATAAPLVGHASQFAPLFAGHGIDPDRVFYCGESVLLADYRGHGIGHAFFDLREAQARACRGAKGEFTHVAFCSVIRAVDDPRTPPEYVPLDGFWMKRGYRPVDGLVGSYRWTEIGAAEATEQAMQFWLKAL